MIDFEQKKAAKEFAEYWKDRGKEKSDSQKFWISLLTEVYGVKDIKSFINFEEEVDKLIDNKTGWVDVFIPSTKVLIEQKSSNVELDQKIRHGDIEITAFQQAWLYSASLNYDDKPRWIVTCNFKSFRIYDMNNRNSEPEEILLKNLDKEYSRLQFLVDSKNEHIKKEEELSFKAGELVGKLYDAFSKQYHDFQNEQSQKDLNELCVRLVFCLYAEDAGLFGRKSVFHDYLSKYEDLNLMRKALIELFRVLDTPNDKRDQYLEDDLNQFPYVNGGLFSNENLEIPTFTNDIREILLAKASNDFDWSEISPTIFGAVFESTLNPETRRTGGMHYTSIENIHKVIDPLFLNDLREKLNEASSYKNEKTRKEKLIEFQKYLASLTFLDPACGSGNFLTETYLSLRRLENEAIELQQGKGVISLDTGDQIKVSIQQFYGIEINDFAVKVAKTALWIAEAQMVKKTEEIINTNINFLPLKSYNNIIEGNALRIDWNDVVPNTKCNYIMGNPPFVANTARSKGKQMQGILDEQQKVDRTNIFGKDGNSLDYVACWFKIAAEYMKNTKIEASFVSTDSICQGQQVTPLWKPIIENGIHINFAYKPFKWINEAKSTAVVYVIILGFSYVEKDKFIFYDKIKKEVKNINAYLIDTENIFVEKRAKPLLNVLPMIAPNKPCDYNNLKIEADEYNQFVNECPLSKKWIKRMVGAEEFINNKERYCLWLVGCSPDELKSMPIVLERVKKCREARIKANTPESIKLAQTPTLFREQLNPDNYLLVPVHSSGSRRYIPIGFLDENTIPVMGTLIIPNADLYYFGILNSNVHMAWTRTVCGYFGPSYRYSNTLVYNTFPWPSPTKEQKDRIILTAQAILDARAKYPTCSLADLYDSVTMPPELIKAHQENDRAVWEAYEKKWNIKSESECVAYLLNMYQELINKNNN